MFWTGSILFFIAILLGFKFKFFQLVALVIVLIYVILVPYYFLVMKTCRNCGQKNPPFRKKCSCCGEENWKQR